MNVHPLNLNRNLTIPNIKFLTYPYYHNPNLTVPDVDFTLKGICGCTGKRDVAAG